MFLHGELRGAFRELVGLLQPEVGVSPLVWAPRLLSDRRGVWAGGGAFEGLCACTGALLRGFASEGRDWGWVGCSTGGMSSASVHFCK